jgi:hypothetical protein
MRFTQLSPHFVETIPEAVEPGVLYVSMSLASAIHLCACGCGQEVITPLSPTDWKLYFDGENVSLEPSIGNWSFPCRSHYWIRGGKVRWSGSMSAPRSREADSAISNGRAITTSTIILLGSSLPKLLSIGKRVIIHDSLGWQGYGPG